MPLEDISKTALSMRPEPENDVHYLYGKPLKLASSVRTPRETIVVTNGVQIKSTLNPNAKEFYPSYMKQDTEREIEENFRLQKQNIYKCEDIQPQNFNTFDIGNNIGSPRQCADIFQNEPMPNNKGNVSKILEIIESVKKISKNNIKNSESAFSETISKIAKDRKDIFSRCFDADVGAQDNFRRKSVPLQLKDAHVDLRKISPYKNNGLQETGFLTTPLDMDVNKANETLIQEKDDSDSDENIPLNHLSKSQTSLMPSLTKEILEGLAPPTTPRSTFRPNFSSSPIMSKRHQCIDESLNDNKNSKTTSKIGSPILHTKSSIMGSDKKDSHKGNLVNNTLKLNTESQILKRPITNEPNKMNEGDMKANNMNATACKGTLRPSSATIKKLQMGSQDEKKYKRAASSSKATTASGRDKSSYNNARASSVTRNTSNKLPSASPTPNFKLYVSSSTSKSNEISSKASRSPFVSSSRTKSN